LLNLKTEIYMGELDTQRQEQNVLRMKLLGATVHPVKAGTRTLKEAVNEALRDWITNVRDTHYVLGTVAGPHPFPTMVRFFQEVIGNEAREQILSRLGKLPEYVVACVGGGSNAIGIFTAFRQDTSVQLIGVEPAGEGLESNRHGAVLAKGIPGTLHGMRSMLLQDKDGQVQETHSISAGLDYPSVGPEHAFLQAIGAARYEAITDAEAMAAFHEVARSEGILPALETSHALAYTKKMCADVSEETVILINLSGRGDKDLQQVLSYQQQNGQD
jgi:tryptophan synthase beta chain